MGAGTRGHGVERTSGGFCCAGNVGYRETAGEAGESEDGISSVAVVEVEVSGARASAEHRGHTSSAPLSRILGDPPFILMEN